MRGRARRAPVSRVDRIEPTPETLAKLVPDQIRVLFDKGRLHHEHTRAVGEIRAVFHAVTTNLFARAKDYRLRGYSPPCLPNDLAEAHRDRYKPWAQQMGRRLPLLIDAIIDGRRIDGDLLIDALDAYVALMRPKRHTIAEELGR